MEYSIFPIKVREGIYYGKMELFHILNLKVYDLKETNNIFVYSINYFENYFGIIQ